MLLLAQGSCMFSLVYELVGKTLPLPSAHLTTELEKLLHFYPCCRAVLWCPPPKWQGRQMTCSSPAARGGGGVGVGSSWNWLVCYIIKMYDFSLRNSKSVLGQSKQREKNVDSLTFSQACFIKFWVMMWCFPHRAARLLWKKSVSWLFITMEKQ